MTTQFSADVLHASADRALVAVASVGADEQADLVDAWLKSQNVAAIAAVAREDDAPAPARKAARRALNVLKSRGVALPDARAVSKPLAGAAVERRVEARMQPLDSSGQQVFTLLSIADGKETRVVDVVCAPGAGVLRVSGGELSPSKYREWEKSSRQRRGFAPTPVSPEYARFRVAGARAENAKSGALLPLELAHFDDLLAGAPDTEPPHPVVAAGLPLEPAGWKALLDDSGDLHREPELAWVLPTQEAFQELLVKLGERVAAAGGKEPDADTFSAYLREEIAAATDRFFTVELRELLGQRLLDAAASVLHRAGRAPAERVLAVRHGVLSAGLVTDSPREIGFLRGAFEKTFAAMVRQSGGQISLPLPRSAEDGGTRLSAEQLAAIDAAKTEAAAADPA
ncbi:MAG: hypothetical protein IT374_25845 [Polyangiaceae bacterium]|nr:hypothetical protein [Polyangiaceae bacterium]